MSRSVDGLIAKKGLADDIRLTIALALLGDGTPFFDRVGRESREIVTALTPKGAM
jgi:hypothetical protein